MTFHIELWDDGSWRRVCSNLPSQTVAENMKRTLADRAGVDPDNYSILVEVDL